jgi:hypothetical protein
MKTYPYQDGDRLIQLVEKRELDQLLERLAEARESHLAASARDVQTIQKQAILLERFAKALGRCTFRDWFASDDTGEVIVALDAGEVRSALSAYESTNLEPVNPVDVQTIQRQSVELASADREIERLNLMVKMMDESEDVAKWQTIAERLAVALQKCLYIIGDPSAGPETLWRTDDEVNEAYHMAIEALSAYESANFEPVANPIDEAVKRMEEVPVLELNKLHFDAMDYGNFNDIEAVRARLISAAKGKQL